MSSENSASAPAPSGSKTAFQRESSSGSAPTSSFAQVQAAEEAALGGGRTPRSALCISGGGIRSATFALGALQGLADLGILENFDYLSTVSGGGYIGSWLTAWKQRQNGLKNIIDQLKSSARPISPGEPNPIQHLREYSNYLSPKLGFFSVDTWTLAATVMRNMLLNWLVFIPLLLCGLMLPRIALSMAWLGEIYGDDPEMYRIGTPLLAITAGAFFATGIYNLLRYLPSFGNKDNREEDFLKFCLAPLVLAALTVFIMEAWFTGGDTQKHHLPIVTFLRWFLGMSISGAAGWFAYLLSHKDLWRKWKLILGFTVALWFTVLSLAGTGRFLSRHFSDLSWAGEVTLALPLFLVALAFAVTVFVGLTSNMLAEEDREWMARAAAWLFLTILIWAGACTLVLVAPVWVLHLSAKAKSAVAAAGGISGFVAALAGFSNQSKAQPSGEAASTNPGKNGKLLNIAGKLAAPIFILVFLTGLALLTNVILCRVGLVQADWWNHDLVLEDTPVRSAAMLFLIFLAFSWIMARYININRFSLQAMYRNRLIRAYLGASNQDRHTNPFTGFADNDNLAMAQLTPSLKPFHVINITLNLVSGERLAWQQRKARSFTVSPLHCGYGDWYCPANEYGGGISLGTAVAISGAAASPNMGYHTSSALAFVMTLLNARLGSWLGNPRQRSWKHQGPRSAFDSIVREAFGLTNDRSPYIYLSDGGHFENLALYEMVRRRCRYIVVLDGAADPKYMYEDVGNALRKIRIDLNVSIEFEEPFLTPLRKPENRCAIARIRYKELDPTLEDGYLVYIKPIVIGNEPPDVTSYKAANDDFPHQSTADQWFDESQTECYRMLGLYSVSRIFKPWDKSRCFEGLLENSRSYLGKGKAADAAAAVAGGKKA